MLLETLRMTHDALTDSTNGVNAQLSSIPLDAGDDRPSDIVRFLEESQDDAIVADEAVPDWPVLTMGVESGADLSGQASQQKHDADAVVVTILYVTGDADSAEAVSDTYYTMRAIYRALESFKTTSSSNRTLNKVQIIRLAERTYGPAQKEITMGTITGFFRVTWQVRDTGAKD